jgi:hypothetical protein
VNSRRVHDRVRVVERALAELQERGVLYGFEKEEQRGKRNKLLDILYTLRPTIDFVSEMKRANKRNSQNYQNAALPSATAR